MYPSFLRRRCDNSEGFEGQLGTDLDRVDPHGVDCRLGLLNLIFGRCRCLRPQDAASGHAGLSNKSESALVVPPVNIGEVQERDHYSR